MDGHTALQEVDGDYEETFLRIRSDENPLHVGEWPPRDAHPLPFAEIRVGKDRKTRSEESLNRLDLRIGDHSELVPALPKDAHEPARLVDLEIARLVHRMSQKEVSAEQRDAREAPDPAASGPRLDRGKEQIEALGGELVTDQLLAIAVRPKDAPARDHRFRDDFWQGFAPFGLPPVLGYETNHSSLLCRAAGEACRAPPSRRHGLLRVTWRQSSEAVCFLCLPSRVANGPRHHPPPLRSEDCLEAYEAYDSLDR